MTRWPGGPRSWPSARPSLPGSADVRAALEAEFGREVLAISAVTGQGLDRLLHAMLRALDAPAED